MERPETPEIPFSSSIPFMTQGRFAALSGLEEGVVRGMINKGYLPTVKIGRYRLVNLVALSRGCDQEWEL